MGHPVVIIGAGFSGLIALKSCKEEGLHAICFEKTDNVGGLWRYRDGDYEGIASVTRSTIINTSKEMSAMSDFPPPKEYANFMHHSKILKYLDKYAQHFDLTRDVRFEHQVLKVSKANNFEETGEWTVLVRNKQGGESEVRASAVMVCIGHHVFPNVPSFPGQSQFRGQVMHTHSYKDYLGLDKRNVLVVGIGNSGMDAAVELSQVSNQVYLSTRRGGWIIQRLGANGIPIDYGTSRLDSLIYTYFPNYHTNKMETGINSHFDHALYNMKPKHRYNEQHPTLSDSLPSRIMCGAVMVKSDIERFTEKGVVFKGEPNREYEVDLVILATGYTIKFPFLDGNVSVENNEVELYKRVIPPRLSHPTLAIVGLVQPIGPIFPVAEMQTRWFTKILKGQIRLPPEKQRVAEVREFVGKQRSRFVKSPRHTIEVDMVPYMDSLAEELGCKPNLFKLFFTDYQLFCSLLFGPSLSYQYRLTGPNPWPEARNAILTVNDRMRAPFNTRIELQNGHAAANNNNHKKYKGTSYYVLAALTTVASGIAAYYYAVVVNV